MKNIITTLFITMGALYTPISNAQVDYSKIKTDKRFIYEGDVAINRSNSHDTSQSKNYNSQNLSSSGSARDNTNARRKSLKDKELAQQHAMLAAQQKQYNFESQQRPQSQKIEGYNQLISNKDDYKYTKFDPSYFNEAKNPFPLQKHGKYKHLFNNPNQSRFCWDQAASYYGLDPWLLFAVAKVESSFNANAINQNKDAKKSTDYGLMQINTFWLPHLLKVGIQKEHLFDPCTSIFVGAWVMKSNIDRFGYNVDGIGAYNSPHNLQIRRNYGNKVIKAYYEVISDFGYTK